MAMDSPLTSPKEAGMTVEAMVSRMAALITLAANVVVTLKGMIRIEVSYLSAYTSTPSEESFLREEGELR